MLEFSKKNIRKIRASRAHLCVSRPPDGNNIYKIHVYIIIMETKCSVSVLIGDQGETICCASNRVRFFFEKCLSTFLLCLVEKI